MFKIDKSSVYYIDLNKNSLVSRQGGAPEEQDAAAMAAVEQAEEEARAAAEQIIANAKYEAGVIVSDATLKYENIRSAAWQSGYNEGLEQAREQVEKRREGLEKRVGELSDLYEQQLERFEENLSRLAFAIAKKIIFRKLKEDDDAFADLIRRAVEQFNASGKFVVRVGPAEYDRFFAEGADWLAEQMQCAPFAVARDDSLPAGGCELESEGGVLRAGVDVQLHKTAEILGIDPDQCDEEF